MRLFVMTSGIQTGKTTWIRRMLHAAGTDAPSDKGAFGVDYGARILESLDIAGVYTPARFEHGEKTGIDAVLLPGGERFCFADRRSLGTGGAQQAAAGEDDGSFDGHRARWRFDKSAIERVNAYFLDERCTTCDLLLIDELGWLEFEREDGFVNALALLDARAPKNALIVVRRDLLSHPKKRWGDIVEISPETPIEAFFEDLA